MPPKPQKKTPKKTNITRPVPGGVKKRGESTAYARKATRKHPEYLEYFYKLPTVVKSTLHIGVLSSAFTKLDKLIREYKLDSPAVPARTKSIYLKKASKRAWTLLHAAFSAIGDIDDGNFKSPIMLFDLNTGNPVSMKDIREFAHEMIKNMKNYANVARARGETYSPELTGFDEFFVVPLYTLQVLVNAGYLTTLTPYRRELFMVHYKWVKEHTPPIVIKYISGQSFSNANLAKIRGTTYTPNLFRGSAPMNATAASRKRSR